MPFLLPALLLGCAPQTLTFVLSEGDCTDVDFNTREDPVLVHDISDAGDIVYLNYVWLPDDSEMNGEVTSDGRRIDVREAWIEGSSDTEACFAPTLTLEDPPKGQYQVFWFRDDSDIAYDSVLFEIE